MTKNILLALLFLMVGHSILSAQAQRSFITMRTATWCSNCGSGAWGIMEDIVNGYDDEAVIISAHYDSGSNYYNETAKNLLDSTQAGNGQPIFFHNTQIVGGGNPATQPTLIGLIEESAMQSPEVEVVLSMGWDPNAQEVGAFAEVVFQEDVEGEYTLSLFLVETEVVGFQANRGPDAVHKRILREALTNAVMGDPITSGSVASGFTKNFGIQFPLGDYALDNIRIVGVVWEKVNGDHVYVNSNWSDQVELVNSISDQAISWEFKAQPNPVEDRIFLSVQADRSLDDVKLELVDGYGRLVRHKRMQKLPAGDHALQMEVRGLPAGIYALRLRSGQEQSTTKIVIR